jgi:biopolymer transport protein ExbD
MKKCSHSHHHALAELNITPLLDLAFVLLIIFVITTPLLEQSLNLKLSPGGRPDKPLDKQDIKTVEISAQGVYMFDRHRVTLDQLESELKLDFSANPNLVVYIRADENSRNRDLYAVIDRCERNGITRYSFRTEPPNQR